MATTKKAIAEAEQAAEIKETIAAPTTEPETPAVTLDELENMDMNMFDAEETESAPRPAWRITDDGCADWACRKIAEEKTELDRITALGESQIVVEGRISTRKWKDEKTGQNRKAVEVVASNIYFADSNGGNANGNPQPANNDGFMDIPDDGQLPFN